MVQVVLEDSGENIRDRITSILRQQRAFFGTGKTREIEFRLERLKRLRHVIKDQQEAILAAVQADLNKPAVEAYISEIGFVVTEINYAIKHLRAWAKPKSVAVPLEQLPAKAQVYAEPLGVVLIIAPWNYPVHLTLLPLVGAIAAGNCALIKPSELAPASSRLIANLIQTVFESSYIAVVEGDVEVSQAILDEKFDHIFFTGSTAIGKIVMQAAARHLTPVTLELGGKNPCIVDAEVHLEHAAKRIVWGKFINAGQTCVAPDYLLVDRRIKPALISAIKTAIREFYGEYPAESPDYAHIINLKQFTRLQELLRTSNVVMGGETIADRKYIAPSVVDQVSWDDQAMQDEIFGPILLVLEYDKLEEAIAQINARPKPLALYLFSKNLQWQQRVLQQISSGGVCINDTVLHMVPSTLPFGGVGNSGMGSYHGKAGFDTFSHKRSVLSKPFWLDLPWRYPPYAGKLEFLKRLMG
ncbi:MAG: aldehyde dehydrogenase [Leptolyngbyaceae cyanobacterium CRU_2_3]|nr:aldehyde dehydrogenase [Leptolyngbyaceae cyanobacterium CRU_2_3]